VAEEVLPEARRDELDEAVRRTRDDCRTDADDGTTRMDEKQADLMRGQCENAFTLYRMSLEHLHRLMGATLKTQQVWDPPPDVGDYPDLLGYL
jgi:hypothetical protein